MISVSSTHDKCRHLYDRARRLASEKFLTLASYGLIEVFEKHGFSAFFLNEERSLSIDLTAIRPGKTTITIHLSEHELSRGYLNLVEFTCEPSTEYPLGDMPAAYYDRIAEMKIALHYFLLTVDGCVFES